MRNEREAIEEILDVARQDDAVRAVIRTDIVPKRKYLHTYNFYFIVNDIEKYDKDVFQSCFGERILLFRGDRNYPEMFPGTKAHLMVFREIRREKYICKCVDWRYLSKTAGQRQYPSGNRTAGGKTDDIRRRSLTGRIQ